MPEPPGASRPVPLRSNAPQPEAPAGDRVACERCGHDMFRMHAVWRCPNCGFKTDCCGW